MGVTVKNKTCKVILNTLKSLQDVNIQHTSLLQDKSIQAQMPNFFFESIIVPITTC